MVSCKRKTHHLTVAWKKQLGAGRSCDAANKENEIKCLQDTQQDIFCMDPWEVPENVNNNRKTGRTGSEPTDFCTLAEVRKTNRRIHTFYFFHTCVAIGIAVCCDMQMKLSEFSDVFQLTKDHNTVTDVLFGRNLRLKVALTLWQRDVGELLTYFLRYVPCSWIQTIQHVCYNFMSMLSSLSLYRIQDTCVFVDFLPLISKRCVLQYISKETL